MLIVESQGSSSVSDVGMPLIIVVTVLKRMKLRILLSSESLYKIKTSKRKAKINLSKKLDVSLSITIPLLSESFQTLLDTGSDLSIMRPD